MSITVSTLKKNLPLCLQALRHSGSWTAGGANPNWTHRRSCYPDVGRAGQGPLLPPQRTGLPGVGTHACPPAGQGSRVSATARGGGATVLSGLSGTYRYPQFANFTKIDKNLTNFFLSNFRNNFFCILFLELNVFWPLLCLCRPSCIFGRCLDLNPESCRSKRVALPT